MTVNLERFIALRPFHYHVTARSNRAALLSDWTLRPAAELMRLAGREDLLRWRRPESITVDLPTGPVVIKDQHPLIEANLSLDGSWELGDFVEYLNEHVFFWPGRADGPISHGQRLLGRYDATAPLVLRVPTSDLLAANPGDVPLFCAFNSGAPRRQQGQRVRRGPHLFAPADRFGRRESEVVELAFRCSVRLPQSVELRTESGWAPLDHAF